MINERPIIFNSEVVNKILINDNLIETWILPEGHTFGELGGEIGDTWNGSEYIKPIVETPEPTSSDVEAERKRRIVAFLLMATGKQFTWSEASNTIIEATREATTLLNIKVKYLISNTNPDWTPTQAARAAGLESMSQAIDGINLKAAEITALNPIPTDFKNNSYWT